MIAVNRSPNPALGGHTAELTAVLAGSQHPAAMKHQPAAAHRVLMP